MSNLLYKEPPIAVSPTMMRVLGVSEAIFLQQVHYWIEKKKERPDKYIKSFVNGQWWVYNSMSEWAEKLSFLGSERTIQRIIYSLRDQGILIVEKHNDHKYDKSNWYRINYLRLDQLVNSTRQNDEIDHDKMTNTVRQNDEIDHDKMTRPIPETTTEKTSKTSQRVIDHSPVAHSHAIELFDYFDLDSEQEQSKTNAPSISNVSDFQKSDLAPGDCGKVEKRKLPRGGHDPEGFAKFWAQYPRKTAKANAQSAWNRLKANAELQAMIMHDLAQRKQADHQWRDVAFIPHPATYLNGKRWEDDVIKPSSPPPMPRHIQTVSEDEAKAKARLAAIARITGGAL